MQHLRIIPYDAPEIEDLLGLADGATTMAHIGNRATIDEEAFAELIQMLRDYPLCRRFETREYGEGVEAYLRQGVEFIGGQSAPYLWSIFGNFQTYSYGFMGYTRDSALAELLHQHIAANVARPDWQAQPSIADRAMMRQARMDKDWRERMRRKEPGSDSHNQPTAAEIECVQRFGAIPWWP